MKRTFSFNLILLVSLKINLDMHYEQTIPLRGPKLVAERMVEKHFELHSYPTY
jgi:hypothetical protein